LALSILSAFGLQQRFRRLTLSSQQAHERGDLGYKFSRSAALNQSFEKVGAHPRTAW
jgi:hypothetical protein